VVVAVVAAAQAAAQARANEAVAEQSRKQAMAGGSEVAKARVGDPVPPRLWLGLVSPLMSARAAATTVRAAAPAGVGVVWLKSGFAEVAAGMVLARDAGSSGKNAAKHALMDRVHS